MDPRPPADQANAIAEALRNAAAPNPELKQAATPLFNAGRREFDVFLSHSARDTDSIKALKAELEALQAGGLNLKVYVDWIDDTKLDRTKVTKETASALRDRMHKCHVLVLAVTRNSARSRWVPWELGFFDGYSGEIYIYPLEDGVSASETGVEFLDFYEHLAPDTAAETIRRAVEARRSALLNRADEAATIRQAERSANVTAHPSECSEVLPGWGSELVEAAIRWQGAWLRAMFGGGQR
jgi:hypothetical protein